MFLYHTKLCLGKHSNFYEGVVLLWATHSKSTDWFLYDGNIGRWKVNYILREDFFKDIWRSLPHTKESTTYEITEKICQIWLNFFYPHFLLRPEFNNTEHSIETYILLGQMNTSCFTVELRKTPSSSLKTMFSKFLN